MKKSDARGESTSLIARSCVFLANHTLSWLTNDICMTKQIKARMQQNNSLKLAHTVTFFSVDVGLAFCSLAWFHAPEKLVAQCVYAQISRSHLQTFRTRVLMLNISWHGTSRKAMNLLFRCIPCRPLHKLYIFSHRANKWAPNSKQRKSNWKFIPFFHRHLQIYSFEEWENFR